MFSEGCGMSGLWQSSYAVNIEDLRRQGSAKRTLHENTLCLPAPSKYTFLAVINLCLRKIYLPPSQEEAKKKGMVAVLEMIGNKFILEERHGRR
jgi:hypothetical protein